LTPAEPASVTNFPLLSLGAGGTAAKVAIDAVGRASAIDGAIARLDEFYVFPEVAKQIGDSLHARQKRGAYDKSTNGIVFAQTLNDEVRAISHDKHMRVNYSVNPLPPQPAGPPPAPSPEMRARMQQQMDAQNCGFVKVEQLEGNIGYLKFNFFAD